MMCTSTVDDILDYCRTMYVVSCRDGFDNTTFKTLFFGMVTELESLDGKEAMEKLKREAILPPKGGKEVRNG